MNNKKIVLAVYQTKTDVDKSLQVLLSEFSAKMISILMPQKYDSINPTAQYKNLANEANGRPVGIMASTSTYNVPGIGACLATGPLISTLSDVQYCNSLDAFANALCQAGVAEHESQRYQHHLEFGGILISIHAETAEDISKAIACLRSTGGLDISSTSEAKSDWKPSLIVSKKLEILRMQQ